MSGGAEPILLQILLIILGAKLGGEAAERFKQPAVLGELVIGVLVGASVFGGFLGMPDFATEQEFHDLEGVLHEDEGALADADNATHANVTQAQLDVGRFVSDHSEELFSLKILSALATIGVILLLFEVGLESDVKELTRVGLSSLMVGLIGIVASFCLGYGFSWLLSRMWDPWQAAEHLMGQDHLLHIFVGAALTATSVGITARVLGDMGRLNTKESRIILGAAVIDDIGGLIILAVVAAMVDAALGEGGVSTMQILWIAFKAIGFLVVALLVGLRFVPQLYDGAVDRFRVHGFPVALAIGFALLMSYLATVFGLADIVGAFAGGLILAQTKQAHKIFEDLRPIAAIFVSFFFVTLGMRVDLRDMGTSVPILLTAAVALTLIAMVAKLACGFGIMKGTKANRLIVGVGMAPRGEVGLIFASLGLGTGLIVNWQYTMIIIVVMLTTFVTPIWLKRLQDGFEGGRGDGGQGREEALSHVLEV